MVDIQVWGHNWGIARQGWLNVSGDLVDRPDVTWLDLCHCCVRFWSLWPGIRLNPTWIHASMILQTFFSCTSSAPGDNPYAGAAGSTAGARSQSWANFAHSLELMRLMASKIATAIIKPHWADGASAPSMIPWGFQLHERLMHTCLCNVYG